MPVEYYSHTSLSIYQSCKRKWFYHYVMRLRPKKKAAPLVIGEVVHVALEHLPSAGIESALGKAKEAYDTSCEMVSVEERRNIWPMVEAVMKRYAEAYKDDDLVTVVPEFEFTITLPGGVKYKGKIDKIGRVKDLYFVVEHKTSGEAPSTFFRRYWMSRQIDGYYLGASTANLPVKITGVIIDALFKPRPRKDGTPGNVPDPQREPFFRDDRHVEEFIKETLAIVAELEALPEGDMTKWIKNTDACFNYGTACHYLDLCRYGMKESIVETLYEVKPVEEKKEKNDNLIQQPLSKSS